LRLSRDVVAGALGLGLSLVLLWQLRGLPKSALVPIGPDFYPRLVLLTTAGLSVALIVGAVLRPPGPAARSGRRNYGLVAASFAWFGLYVAALPLAGFRLSTALFVAALQATLAPPRSARAWLVVAATALITAAAAWWIFERELSVLLPRGRWTGF